MSRCTECLQPMDDFDARYNEVCHDCRSSKKTSKPIRTLSTMNSEHIGRKARASKTLGGTADNEPDPEFENDEHPIDHRGRLI